MKYRAKILVCLIAAAVMVVAVSASEIVSPALNVLAKNNKMIKSGLVYNDVYFCEQDFMKSLGVAKIESVVVKELPSAATGALKLGTINVTEGQKISAEFLSVLRFVPVVDEKFSTELVFTCGTTDIPCTIKYLDEVNYAPTFENQNESLKTYSNVSCYGSIKASDPDGDGMDIQVVMYPEHGTINVTDSSRGNYKYTPSNGFVGRDEFVVVARDDYGNYSSVQTVKVNVENSSIVFNDIVGHWCENAAISLYEEGAIDALNYYGETVFSPDDKITREEFVVAAMKALGVSTLTDTQTSFSDNSDINVKYRPYIATAQRLGYINGKNIEGASYFDPKGNISKAEAAIVINNILEIEEGNYVATFADDAAIPTWAKTAVYALTSAGVFNGDGGGVIKPSAILSRAETVQMIYNAKK